MSLGRQGEALACSFLKRKGFKILHTNYRRRQGEIDIIAEREGYVVFSEVKTRKRRDLTQALEAVDGSKQKQLRKMAEIFLSERGVIDRGYRFDVIAVDLSGTKPQISHLEDAFN